MLLALGRFITKRWYIVLAVWLGALAGLVTMAPSIRDLRAGDESLLLPQHAPSRVAAAQISQALGRPATGSFVAIVMHRTNGLTGEPPDQDAPPDDGSDWQYIHRLIGRLKPLADRGGWDVLSPADRHLRQTLVSQDGVAAVVRVSLGHGFVSREAGAAVEAIEGQITAADPPAGLDVQISGSASYGRDYASATLVSLERTTLVTIIAVIIILLLTYRAIAAAVISLVTVTIAVLISVSLVAVGGLYGWSVSMIVELFTIVIGYGAGVDFSLFYLSRYHEELARQSRGGERRDCRNAAIRALIGTAPAIMASAATTAVALLLMVFAQFGVFSTAGPAVAVSVIVSCLAGLTLTPAVAYLVGPRTFWPRRVARGKSLLGGSENPDSVGPDGRAQGRSAGAVWQRIARFTVIRPVTILLIGLAVLAPLAVAGWRQEVVYDTLADLPDDSPSIRGARLYRAHFESGEMAPLRVLVSTDQPLDMAGWVAVSQAIQARLQPLPHVQQVRGVSHPLGVRGPAITPQQAATAMAMSDGPDAAPGVGRRALQWLAGEAIERAREDARRFRQQVVPQYVAATRDAALWEIALDAPPYSNQALDLVDELRGEVGRALGGTPADGGRIYTAGDTAHMRDLRQITSEDFVFVGLLVVLAIIAIVAALVRDIAVAGFVMLATILTYGASLAVTGWLFHGLSGEPGVDWKVRFFLFVILVAVGQDYNLFILTRIMEERRRMPLRPATQTAITRTGAIISCCGLIMAATLGSLASSPLRLLQELGVAFIIGLLIDTFVVRPLLVPAFVLVKSALAKDKRPSSPACPRDEGSTSAR